MLLTNDLEGVIVCFTGVRDRELLDSMISRGALNSDSKFNLLVAKDPESNSGKAKKAKDKGLPIMSLFDARKKFI